MTPATLSVGDITLEAEWCGGALDCGGVVAHPHPRFGGDMNSHVVGLAMDALSRARWTGLRFNFRGVGGSTGRHDDGRGEQDDLVAAATYLGERVEKLVVIGYSFGAWVAAAAWADLEALGVASLILVAPPVAMMSFGEVDPDARISHLICGERDEIAPPDRVEALGHGLAAPPRVHVVKGADHLFQGNSSTLTSLLEAALPAC